MANVWQRRNAKSTADVAIATEGIGVEIALEESVFTARMKR